MTNQIDIPDTELPTLTDEQLEQLQLHAVNDTTRGVAQSGARLTFEQLDALNEPTIAWLRQRLSCAVVAYSDYAIVVPRMHTPQDSY